MQLGLLGLQKFNYILNYCYIKPELYKSTVVFLGIQSPLSILSKSYWVYNLDENKSSVQGTPNV